MGVGSHSKPCSPVSLIASMFSLHPHPDWTNFRPPQPSLCLAQFHFCLLSSGPQLLSHGADAASLSCSSFWPMSASPAASPAALTLVLVLWPSRVISSFPKQTKLLMALHMLLPPSGRVKTTATVGAHRSTGHGLASNPLRWAPGSASVPRELH